MTKTAKQQYDKSRYLGAVKAGICVLCRKTPVSDRSYCHECSSIQSIRTYRSGLRKILNRVGVDWRTANELTLEQIKTILEIARDDPWLD